MGILGKAMYTQLNARINYIIQQKHPDTPDKSIPGGKGAKRESSHSKDKL